MKRVTVSLPKYLYEELVEQVPTGRVSSFVAQAVETRLVELDSDPVEEFIALRKKVPGKQREEIIKAIKKGRV